MSNSLSPGHGIWGQERLDESLDPWASFLLMVQKGLLFRVLYSVPWLQPVYTWLGPRFWRRRRNVRSKMKMNQRQKMKRRKARRTKNRRGRGKVGPREMEKKTSLRAGEGEGWIKSVDIRFFRGRVPGPARLEGEGNWGKGENERALAVYSVILCFLAC